MKSKFHHNRQGHNNNQQHEEQNLDERAEQKYDKHKQIMVKLKSSSQALQKISKSYYQIKTNAIIVSEALQSDCFPGISQVSSKTLLDIYSQAHASIADHCKDYAGQLHNLLNMYSELVKAKYEQFKEEKENLRHYVQKVRSLSNSPVQRERFERNKEKLKNANSNYNKITQQLDLFLSRTNDQSEKIFEKNFIGFISIFATKYEQAVNRTKQTLQNTDHEQIIVCVQGDIQISPNSSHEQHRLNFPIEIQKLLTTKKTPTHKILIANAFRTGKTKDTNKSTLGVNSGGTKQRIFGIKSAEISNSYNQSNNKLTNSYSMPQTHQWKQNNFSNFDNIFSDKNEKKASFNFTAKEDLLDFEPILIEKDSTKTIEGKEQKYSEISLLDL